MDIRFIGRVTVLLCLLWAVLFWSLCVVLGKEAGNGPWYLLAVAFATSLLLFRGWGRVGGVAAQGVQRAAPYVQGAGRVVGQQAQNNVAATISVVCLAAFASLAIFGRLQAAMFFLYASILLGIAHYKGTDHFGEYWREYWLAASIVGALHTFAFGYGWKMVAAFIVSATLAAITTFGGWGKTFELAGKGFHKLATFLGKVLFGGYGRDVLCVGWTVLSVLVAMAMPSLAFPAMTVAIGFFIGAVVLGVNDRAMKK